MRVEGSILEPRFTISLRYSLGDLLWFNLYTIPRLRTSQVMTAICTLVFAGLGWATVRSLSATLLEKLVVASVVVVAMWLVTLLPTTLVCLAVYLPRLVAATRKERRLTVSATGVIEEDSDCRHETAWRGVQRVVRIRSAVLIYFSDRCAYLVPKRAFRSREEAEAFYRYAKAQKDL